MSEPCTGRQDPAPLGGGCEKDAARGESFDAYGRLFAPFFLLDEETPVSVLIDPERARWIGTNRLGGKLLSVIREQPGLTGLQLAERVGTNGSGEVSFLRAVHGLGFLGHRPFETPVRGNRRDLMEPDRLHEFWVVTNDDCNLRCRHCYTIERVKRGRTGLGGEALRQIIAEAHALGTEVFYFTGGEPTLRPDFLDLAKFVLERAKLILFSNGTTITEELARALSVWRDRLVVQVSVEAPDEPTSRAVRGKGSLEQALRGVRALLAQKIPVGVSTVPTGVSHQSVPQLTANLARMAVDGQRPDFHHLIMLLDRGGARQHEQIGAFGSKQFTDLLDRSEAAIREARRVDHEVKLKLTNEKILRALATNGPAKDYCGAGYTILGVSADGKLLPCAACMDDDRYFLADLVDDSGNYRPGALEAAWRTSDQVEAVRRFSLAPKDGRPVRDLRYFHGGGCWKNMDDPTLGFAETHPFAEYYESAMLAAIRKVANEGGCGVEEQRPELVSFMNPERSACAGNRKTRVIGEGGVDQGHCICFV